MKHTNKLTPRTGILAFLVLLGTFLSLRLQAEALDKLQDVKLTLMLENVPLQDALNEIEKKSEFRFLYKNNEIDLVRKVTIKQEQTSLKLILNKLFSGTNITYEVVVDKIVLWKANPTGSSIKEDPNGFTPDEKKNERKVTSGAVTPDRVVSGTVKSADGAEPLPGVSVAVKGTSKGTITDAAGKYSLEVPDNATLVFSFIGFLAKEVSVGTKTVLDVALSTDARQLEELVVVGYGTQRKRDATGSISSINAEQIDRVPNATITSVLQGKVAGLNMMSNSGEPGGGVTVRLRGTSSLNAGNDPLYIIDGIPVQAQSMTELNGGGTAMNPLADIDPADIESVEVLKDAASAAIYGSRAANGVIIITTKRGKAGKPVIAFNTFTGLSSVNNKLPVVNAVEYRQIRREMSINGLGDFDRRGTRDSLASGWAADYSMQDEIFRQALMQKYDARISGGTSALSYALSGGYLNQEGVVLDTKYSRLTLRSNVDYEASSKVKAGTSLSYSRSASNRTTQGSGTNFGSTIRSIVMYPSVFPLYDVNTGEINPLPNDKLNPLAVSQWIPSSNAVDRFLGSVYFEWQPVKNLKFRPSVSYDMANVLEDIFFHKLVQKEGNHRSEHRVNRNNSWISENILTYNNTIGDHNFTALAGYNLQKWRRDREGITGIGFASTTIKTTNAASVTQAFNTISENALASYIGRITYDYKAKYLLNINLRRDGSSRFGEANRWGWFPSFSVGWRFTDEIFFQHIQRFAEGKLRASWGKVGNQEIGNYDAQGSYAVGDKYLGIATISPSILLNPNLKWETTTQPNLGLDLTFLNNRIELNADYYVKTSRDLLFDVNIPQTTGFKTITTNLGEIENRGLELALNTRQIDTEKFSWRTTTTFARNRNKVLSLPESKDMISGVSIVREGEAIGSFYGYKMLGVFSRDEDNAFYPKEHAMAGQKIDDPNYSGPKSKLLHTNGTAFRGGDVWFEDITRTTDANGNYIINDQDRQIIGSSQPRFTGGFLNTVSYKNLSLDVAINFSYGNQVYNQLRRDLEAMTSNTNFSKNTLKRWRQPGDVTDVPRAVGGDPVQNARTSSRWVEDASYTRVRFATLSYKLPRQLVSRVHVKNLSVFVQGQNFLTFSNYQGFDPEVNMNGGWEMGIDNGGYPATRSFNLGINAEF